MSSGRRTHVDGDTCAPELGDGWHLTALDPGAAWRTSRSGIRYRFPTLTR